uniref:Uncharacterized protein n=1 Tax=Physcomitrium patens TaxID=3218 RepID=A0A2K1L9Q1_PHYPA|nr:hypothetical protein PHYPA_001183 [Physcomitrium patens]
MELAELELDSRSMVWSVVLKAYVVSLLLLLSVLVWSVGDVWLQYVQDVFTSACVSIHYSLSRSSSSS